MIDTHSPKRAQICKYIGIHSHFDVFHSSISSTNSFFFNGCRRCWCLCSVVVISFFIRSSIHFILKFFYSTCRIATKLFPLCYLVGISYFFTLAILPRTSYGKWISLCMVHQLFNSTWMYVRVFFWHKNIIKNEQEQNRVSKMQTNWYERPLLQNAYRIVFFLVCVFFAKFFFACNTNANFLFLRNME